MKLRNVTVPTTLSCLLVLSSVMPALAQDIPLQTSKKEVTQLSSVSVTNGLLTIPFASIPKVAPKSSDFSLYYTVNAKKKKLTPSATRWDEATGTALISFKPFNSGSEQQEIVISGTYNKTETFEQSITLAKKDAEVETVELINTRGDSELQLNVANDRQLSLLAIAKDSTGAIVTGHKVSFSSDNKKVAYVYSSGSVYAKKAGSTEITATIEGEMATFPVEVVEEQKLPSVITKSGTYGPESGIYQKSGKITINGKKTKVTLQNTKIKGDLVINNGGTVTLSNVEVTGEILVKNVASKSLHLEGVETDGLVITDRDGARIVADDTSQIPVITVSTDSAKAPIKLEGSFGDSTVHVSSPSALLVDTAVSQVVVDEKAAGTIIDTTANTRIDAITTKANLQIEGAGKVESLIIDNQSVTVQSTVSIPSVSYSNNEAPAPAPAPTPTPAPTVNQAPTAVNVTISGDILLGETLTGSYTYQDAENNPERTSLFKWYRGDLADGSDKTLISGATKKTYTLQQDDVGKYITFEVMPIASSGTRNGSPVTYTSVRTVKTPTVNQAPTIAVAYSASTLQNTAVSDVVSGSDADGDTLTYLTDSSPSHGGVIVNPDGTWTYTPAIDYVGTDSFSIAVNDGNGGTATTTVTVTIEEDAAVLDREALEIGYAAGDDEDNVTNHLTLATSGAHGSTISWSSDHPALVDDNGTVIRPLATDEDTDVTLTATITKGTRTVTKVFTVTVRKAANTPPNPSNAEPTVLTNIEDQIVLPGRMPYPQIDLSTIFQDPDGDALTYEVSADVDGIVQSDLIGSVLSMSPISGGQVTFTVTARDGKGGEKAASFVVKSYQLVQNGEVAIKTKSGVQQVKLDLSKYFPASEWNSQKMLLNGTWGTHNGSYLALAPSSVSADGVWLVANDYTALHVSMDIEGQGASEVFFSEYVDGTDARNALQLYYKGTDPNLFVTGYELEVHKYMTDKNQMNVWTVPINQVKHNTVYIYIDNIFYDYFDVVNAWYYNEEIDMSINGYVTAFVLKKNGQVVDVLGNPDPSNRSPILEKTGTIVRKQGIYTGSQSFNLVGEWDVYPTDSFQFLGNHQP
ncbi:immunoglobulin-like domain-containing protein [Brevibacillus centrosporus]|uniref:immunoglobulin-like domain-containing protein n=1 Tax=Brevibacillus centrosporus TaxID=54910 RepID=UPI002E1BE06C|nr:Ig-like domain-containing protein [Brevibacillus centrosporus]